MTARRRRDLEEAAEKGDADAIAELALEAERRQTRNHRDRRRSPLSAAAYEQKLAASPVRTPGIRRTGSPGAWEWWYDPTGAGPYKSRQGAHWEYRRHMAELDRPICAGCDVLPPWEHRCHGVPCSCRECRLDAAGGGE